MISLFFINTIRELENELDLPQEERYTDTDFFHMGMASAAGIIRKLKLKMAEEQRIADEMLKIQSIISKF